MPMPVTMSTAPRPLRGVCASRAISAATGGEAATTVPPMSTNTICMVKGMRLQKPSPKLLATASGAAPAVIAASATAPTASVATMKASGNQRSDQSQQACAKRASPGSVCLLTFVPPAVSADYRLPP